VYVAGSHPSPAANYRQPFRFDFVEARVPDPESRGDAAAPVGDRRQFLTWLSRAFLGLWAVGAAAVVSAYVKPPRRGEGAAERTVRVGLLEDLPIGEGRLVRHGVTPFHVIRLDATRIVAVSAVCTHVRCILGFDRERRALICPCHDGRFDVNGNVVSGPPPRALPTYTVSVRAGEVFVHL
jgi:cytochrome b6-f complex iron-sulfur subunit